MLRLWRRRWDGGIQFGSRAVAGLANRTVREAHIHAGAFIRSVNYSGISSDPAAPSTITARLSLYSGADFT